MLQFEPQGQLVMRGRVRVRVGSTVVLVALSLLLCWLWSSSARAQGVPAAAAGPSERRQLLERSRSWGYQLQNLDVAKLAASPYDVLVIDFPRGDGGDILSARDIARLQKKPDGSRRLVLAYVNIGEAEDYRSYWRAAWAKQPPAWMGSANCRWKGDHRVRHWAPEWQAIIFGAKGSYVGRVIEAGFDGVYLDRVDIYYYWRGERWQGGADMVDFVVRLSEWSKAARPGFLIMPQNGEELLADSRYRRAIDGIGKEDMLYGDRGNDAANVPERIERAVRNFSLARSEGLAVLAVEYTRKPDQIAMARARLAEMGFVPYFGPRSLAYLGSDGPAHKEDTDSEPTIADTGDDGCG